MSEANDKAVESTQKERNDEYVRDAHNAMTCGCANPIPDRSYGGEKICKCGKFIRKRKYRGLTP